MKKGCTYHILVFLCITGIVVLVFNIMIYALRADMKKKGIKSTAGRIERDYTIISKAFEVKNIDDIDFIYNLKTTPINSMEIDKQGKYSIILSNDVTSNLYMIDEGKLILVINDIYTKLGAERNSITFKHNRMHMIIDMEAYKKDKKIIPFVKNINIDKAKSFSIGEMPRGLLRFFWFADENKNIICALIGIDESIGSWLLTNDKFMGIF